MRALSRFSVSDLIATSADLRHLGDDATSLEDVANRVVWYIHNTLWSDDGVRSTVLVRFYKTHNAELLDDSSRRFAEAVLGEPVAPGTKCLTLFGTAGVESAWQDRAKSQGHKAIPLPSSQLLERFPMISSLMTQMGVDVARLLDSQPHPVPNHGGQPYNVFHVVEALGSPWVPDQAGFVEPYGVRSALGFGGELATGDIFAVILFAKEPIAPATASLFRALALAVQVAVMPFAAGPYFAGDRTTIAVRDRSTFRLARAAVIEQLLSVQEQLAADEAERVLAGRPAQ